MPARRKYSWETWFSQPCTVIVRGLDYHCSQAMMWQQIRNNARAHGVKVRVSDHNDYLVIEVIGENTYPDQAPVAG